MTAFIVEKASRDLSQAECSTSRMSRLGYVRVVSISIWRGAQDNVLARSGNASNVLMSGLDYDVS